MQRCLPIRDVRPLLLHFLFVSALTLCYCQSVWGAPGDILYLQIRESIIRETPQHWSAAVSRINYGDSFRELKSEKNWIYGSYKNGVTGYLHASALTPKQVLSAQTAQVTNEDSSGYIKGSSGFILAGKGIGHNKKSNGSGFSSGQSNIVLAGKGWSKEIETQYSINDPSLAYDLVDVMESRKISDADLLKFMRDGELVP